MINKKGLAGVLATVLIWGATPAIIKTVLHDIDPYNLSLFRAIAASVFLCGLILVKKEGREFAKILRVDWKYFLLTSLFGVVFVNLFYAVGLQYTSSSLGGILVNTNPLFILVLSVMFLRESFTKNKILGFVIGFLGVGLIIFNNHSFDELISSEMFSGNIIIIFVSLSYSIYSILGKRVLHKYSPLHLTAVSYVLGMILLVPGAWIFGSGGQIMALDWDSWLIILYLGIVSSGLAFLTWNYGLSKMEASKASIFLYLIPVIAIFVGREFMGETITLYTLAGTGLILGGIYLSSVRKR